MFAQQSVGRTYTQFPMSPSSFMESEYLQLEVVLASSVPAFPLQHPAKSRLSLTEHFGQQKAH